MSELTKKLHILKDGATEEETVTLYSTVDECAEPNLKFEVDGALAYAKLGDVTDTNASSLRIYRNSDSTTYAVLKVAETANMTAGTIIVGYPQVAGFGYFSYSSQGSLSPSTATYNGASYEVYALYSAYSNYAEIVFATEPPFNTVILTIDGTEIIATKQISSYFPSYTAYRFNPTFVFEDGKSYTVHITAKNDSGNYWIDTEGVKHIIYDDEVESYCTGGFQGNVSAVTISLSSATSIEDNTFAYCRNLTSLELPAVTDVTEMGFFIDDNNTRTMTVHFAEANRDAIESACSWYYPFGFYGTLTISFDL